MDIFKLIKGAKQSFEKQKAKTGSIVEKRLVSVYSISQITTGDKVEVKHTLGNHSYTKDYLCINNSEGWLTLVLTENTRERLEVNDVYYMDGEYVITGKYIN